MNSVRTLVPFSAEARIGDPENASEDVSGRSLIVVPFYFGAGDGGRTMLQPIWHQGLTPLILCSNASWALPAPGRESVVKYPQGACRPFKPRARPRRRRRSAEQCGRHPWRLSRSRIEHYMRTRRRGKADQGRKLRTSSGLAAVPCAVRNAEEVSDFGRGQRGFRFVARDPWLNERQAEKSAMAGAATISSQTELRNCCRRSGMRSPEATITASPGAATRCRRRRPPDRGRTAPRRS